MCPIGLRGPNAHRPRRSCLWSPDDGLLDSFVTLVTSLISVSDTLPSLKRSRIPEPEKLRPSFIRFRRHRQRGFPLLLTPGIGIPSS